MAEKLKDIKVLHWLYCVFLSLFLSLTSVYLWFTSNLVLSTPGGSLRRPLWVTASISYGYIWREMRLNHILVTFYAVLVLFHWLNTINRLSHISGLLKRECSQHKQPPKFSLRYCLHGWHHIVFCIQWMRGLEATWMWGNVWHRVRREKQNMKTLEGLVRSASPSVPEY